MNTLFTEAIQLLSGLLQIETTYPPGNELLAAEYLARTLHAEGLDPVVLESTPGRGQVVARLRGTGELPPLLLFSHTDVVPAEPSQWQVPPFSGTIQDGAIWGRGALDMKGIVVMHLITLLRLKRAGVPLRRDIIFAATADEERAGFEGMGWLVDKHPELIQAEYGLSEFGGFPVTLEGRQIFLCQTGEKGYVTLRLEARGRPGHAAVPHGDNPVFHLAAGLQRLHMAGLSAHLTETARAFLAAIATVRPAASRLLGEMEAGARPTLAELQRHFASDDLAELGHAMLRNTATPTQLLTSSAASNVIPSTAEAILDGRNLPGTPAEPFMDEVRALLGELNAHLSVTPIYSGPALEFPLDTPLYAAIGRTLRQHAPDAALAPMLLPGSTDAKHVARLGTLCYGFAPLQLEPGEYFMHLVHSHNERLRLESLRWGLDVFFDLVRDICQ